MIVIIFLRIESWPARTAHQGTAELERIGKNLRAAFIDIAHLQPRITINNRVYMEQTRPVSELVALSRRIEVEHELSHTWVGSSKRVKLHGTFNVKAGFDLRQNLSIDIRPDEIIVQLPHAQILGIEAGQLDVGAVRVALEGSQQPDVNIIKVNRHPTIDYFVVGRGQQTWPPADARWRHEH